ncbi:hypothetical protein ACFQ0M_17190 [Kitasatospora aburaviensis]
MSRQLTGCPERFDAVPVAAEADADAEGVASVQAAFDESLGLD